MSINIESSFIKNFQSDVHLQYQRMGSKLRNTVRVKNNIVGSSTTFQKVGKGTASTKARHGKVPVMNVDHTPVECTLSDFYAGDWVDSLDELKTNINERMVVAKAGAYALGRKTDELIIGQLDTSTNYAGAGTDGLTKTKVLTAFEMLGDADVPDDGDVGEERVNYEPVAGVDGFLLAQVQNNQVLMDGGATLDLFGELFLLLEIEVHPFFDVGQFEDLVDVMIVAALDQFHHQFVIGNAEAPEPAQAGAGVHEKIQQRPARGL